MLKSGKTDVNKNTEMWVKEMSKVGDDISGEGKYQVT